MRARRHRISTAANNGTTVKRSNFPTWMQTPGEKEAVGLKLESDNLAPINVALQWIRGPKVRRNQETEEAIDEAVSKGIEIPRTNQILPCDPRLCISGYQFRDKIKRFMGCRALRG